MPVQAHSESAENPIRRDAGDTTYRELGVFCIVLGTIAGWMSIGYGIGTFTIMGAGFFPLSVSVILAGLGSAILLRRGVDVPRTAAEEVEENAEPETPLHAFLRLARLIGAVLGGILLFGLLVKPAGLLLSSFILVVVSSLGHPAPKLVPTLLLAAGISVVAVLIFAEALGLNLPVLPGAL